MSGELAAFPIVHPMRRPSTDEMVGRGLVDMQDPNATMPEKCSECGVAPTFSNPLMLLPVDRNPKALAVCYLYKSRCAQCCERRAHRR